MFTDVAQEACQNAVGFGESYQPMQMFVVLES